MGNTQIILGKRYSSKDHPHIRGEYAKVEDWAKERGGSPPHPWGILDEEIVLAPELRITPTSVGNTLNYFTDLSGQKDHPHIRGEYSKLSPIYQESRRRLSTFFISLSLLYMNEILLIILE